MTPREYDKALRVSQESEAETVSKRFKDSNRNILKLCLSMVDGALMGEKSGYTGAMQRLIPHHMSVWDGAHRLSLVTNGAYKQSGITEILKHDKWEASVAKYYRKSPKARNGLHAFQRLYGLPILKAEKHNPGRWFARYKASKKHLQLLKPSTAHCLKASGASAKTLAKYQLSAPCQMLSHMKTDLLEPMASISSQLQFKTGRVADHTPAIEATREFIQKRFVETSYIIGSSQTAEYYKMLADDPTKYHGRRVTMCHKVPDVIKELKRFAKKLVKGLDERMGPTKLVSQMAPFQVSYLKAQSKRPDFCAETYGADEIRALASQFSSIPGFDADAAIYEWPMLVRLLAARVKNFPTDDDSAAVDFWEPVLVEINGSPNYKNIIYLVELYVVAVALSVQCERYYSMVKHCWIACGACAQSMFI